MHVIIASWREFRIVGGHTNTERGYLPILAAKLRQELCGEEYKNQGVKEVEIFISQEDRHPLEFV